ncbi:MAG: phosphate/phosphite/phosphonate ABC transporter substrate-binding protein [Bacteriovoracia bacterium]
MRKNIVLRILLVLVISSFLSCTKTKIDEIVIGFNPPESADIVETNGKALASILFDRTGLKLKTFVANDYGALIEAMRSGRVQFAFLPVFSFVQAEKMAGAKVLLKAVRKGTTQYYSAIITAKDYKSIQDLKGKTIAWTDPASASGHIIAKTSLMDMGIDPDTFFSRQIYAGGHDALVLAVANKTVDAGATYSDDPKGEQAAWTQHLKKDMSKKIKVLMMSKPIPIDTFATTEKFQKEHPEIVEKVNETLQQLSHSKGGKKILWDLYHMEGLVPSNSSEFEPVREAVRRLKLDKVN